VSRNLQEKLEAAGLRTREYSGRGMYGKMCLGVVAKSSVAVFASGLSPQEIRTACTDSMGHEVVVYWPNVVRRVKS
jgi:hypothetical protein